MGSAKDIEPLGLERGTRQQPLSVGGLSAALKDMVESVFFDVWVEGELGQLKVHQSGHVYFSLKDPDARIDGVVWRTTARRLQHKPPEGSRVLILGKVQVYPPQGRYQLVVDDLLPAGEGAMQAALEALIARLAAEGLLDPARKRPLPYLPRAVGVVTSATGAARRDIEAVVHRRAPQIPVVLCAAKVQGEGAAEEVARALYTVARHPGVEVVIVGRGGGSAEDLWAFNSEVVARAIAACPVPVISAVGHEVDTTLADLVADFRAPTPSAAAESAVPVRDDLLAWLADLERRLDRALDRRQSEASRQLRQLRDRLQRAVGLDARRLRLDRLVNRLDALARARRDAAGQRLARLRARLQPLDPAARLARSRRRLDALQHRLQALAEARPVAARARLEALAARLAAAAATQVAPRRVRLQTAAARLEALSPLAVLGRGYSLTLRAGRVLRDAAEVAPGDALTVRLAQGSLTATVTGVEPGDPTDSSTETP